MPHGLAVWLLKTFIPSDQFDPVMGDLLEEFSSRKTITGLALARRWFWRHTWRTIIHFLASEFREKPVVNICIILIALALLSYGRMASYFAATAILARYNVYHHISANTFWIIYCIVIGSILMPLIIGWLSAALAKGREMAVTLALTLLGTIPFFWQTLFLLGERHHLIVARLSIWVFFAHMILPTIFTPVAVLLGGTLRQWTASGRVPIASIRRRQ